MANEEYQFPDEQDDKKTESAADDVEVEIEGSEEVEVEVEKPKEKFSKLREEPEEPTEDEVSQYSDRVKKRIDHLYKGFQTEKRKAEAAEREREEAVRLAQAMLEENKKLKGSINQSQSALLEQAKKVVSNELEKARLAYKEAYESGDSDRLVEAQEALTDARMKVERVNKFKPAALQEPEKEVQPQQQEIQRPPVDHKALAWKDENPWFNQDEEMTSFAFGVHAKLIKDGVDPSSDTYYEKLNSRMRQVFPDRFESEEPPATQRKKSNVVAPATRSSSPKKITLTQEQVRLAKRLGLTPQQYAVEAAKLRMK